VRDASRSNEELARILPTFRRAVEEHFRSRAREVAEGKLLALRPYPLPSKPTGADRTLARFIEVATPNVVALVKRIREREDQVDSLRRLAEGLARQ
jgi:hypothetical protein